MCFWNRECPTEKEVRRASLRTSGHDYFQILCNKRTKRLKVISKSTDPSDFTRKRKWHTVWFGKGHIPYRTLDSYVKNGIWMYEEGIRVF